jgi:glycosyltransferase involved in cell wall biosynthesis
MIHDVYVNGRFLIQPISGVQRFATEICLALGRLQAENSLGAPRLLLPFASDCIADPPLEIGRVGRSRGQIWEQFELPTYDRQGVLINLGNTAPLLRRRQIVVIHDAAVFSQPQAYSWKFRAWYKLLQKALAITGTRVVTVSEFSRSEIAKHLGMNKNSIEVITEGADHMNRTISDNRILLQHDLQPGSFVLAVGNLSLHKNLVALFETARMLSQRGIKLVITGSLNRKIFRGNGNLPNPATYVGRISDNELAALYRSANSFVFPSLYEGFGLPAVEAMACGCPVVASDIPALREVCGEAALYADPRNQQDIANRVAQLLDNEGMRALSLEKMQSQVRRYTWEIAASKLLSIAKSL